MSEVQRAPAKPAHRAPRPTTPATVDSRAAIAAFAVVVALLAGALAVKHTGGDWRWLFAAAVAVAAVSFTFAVRHDRRRLAAATDHEAGR